MIKKHKGTPNDLRMLSELDNRALELHLQLIELDGGNTMTARGAVITWVLSPATGDVYYLCEGDYEIAKAVGEEKKRSAWLRCGETARLNVGRYIFFAAWQGNQVSDIQRIDLKKDEKITLRPK